MLPASGTTVSCNSPRAPQAGPTHLALRSSGATFPGAVEFVYYFVPIVELIHPASGPTLGGSHVTVTGSMLPTLVEEITCQFGQAGPTAAWRITASAFVCTSPPWSTGVTRLSFGFSTQISFQNAPLFEFYPPMVINSILPACGPMSGGTELTVAGGTFFQRSAQLSLHMCCELWHPARAKDTAIMSCLSAH